MNGQSHVKSVAVIGAGAAGAVTAAALASENYFETIRVFERRESPGGTWLYDADPGPRPPIRPGELAPEIDPALEIPESFPAEKEPNRQERWTQTPIYKALTTNVPDVAMSFSDRRFAYGPFVPHWVAKQYIENYFSAHRTDSNLELNTALEDLSKPPDSDGWKLTLRKYDPLRNVDVWWQETFDAVVLATGHYSVPFVPHVDGLKAYSEKYPDRVQHSKYYRAPGPFADKRVLVIGNSASGHDVTADLVSTARLPVYQSRKSKSRWDGDSPPPGIEWKPIVKAYHPETGKIIFDDDTHLDGIDAVIYCTGYQPSFPFWNARANGQELWDYRARKLVGVYWHTFFRDLPTLGVVGLPRTLTFRSFEYQAVALARLWSGRQAEGLPSKEEQAAWERERERASRENRTKFHDIPWDDGQTFRYLERFFRIAGLGTFRGEGRIPPALDEELIWAVENIKKYPEPGKDKVKKKTQGRDGTGEGREVAHEPDKHGGQQGDGGFGRWVVVEHGPSGVKDSLAFI